MTHEERVARFNFQAQSLAHHFGEFSGIVATNSPATDRKMMQEIAKTIIEQAEKMLKGATLFAGETE